jgi:hypothetical protein
MCDCATKVNELLVKERGCRLGITTNLSTGKSRVAIKIEPIAGIKMPKVNIFRTFCPFCGEKYEE